MIVTGSCGRIGTQVVRKLGSEFHVVGFELLKAIYACENEELVPVDLGSDESVEQAFRHIRHFYGNKIASVIHLAAYYSFSDQNYDNYERITVRGTERLLKALSTFEEAVQSIPQIVECYSTSGDKDYILQIVINSVEEYEKLLRSTLLKLPNVGSIHSTFSLKQIKYTTQLPI